MDAFVTPPGVTDEQVPSDVATAEAPKPKIKLKSRGPNGGLLINGVPAAEYRREQQEVTEDAATPTSEGEPELDTAVTPPEGKAVSAPAAENSREQQKVEEEVGTPTSEGEPEPDSAVPAPEGNDEPNPPADTQAEEPGRGPGKEGSEQEKTEQNEASRSGLSVLGRMAIAYAKRGLHVFPLKPGSKVPLTAHGVKDATSDVQQVEEWWTDYPNANIGVLAGEKSNILVVDVDVKDGAQGAESLAALEAEHGPLNTLKVQTPSGGQHLYFQLPENHLWNAVGILPGIDLRTDNGYAILPPSQIGGIPYRWLEKREMASMPPSLVEAFWTQKKSKAAGGGGHGRRNLGEALQGVAQGSRNSLVFDLACRLHQEGIPYEQARVLVRQAAANCTPPLPEDETERCLNSAFSYSSGPGECTEFANTDRFVGRHGNDIRHVVETKKWLIFDGNTWQPDRDGEIYRMGKATVRSIRTEVTADMDEDTQKAILAHARRSETKAKLQAMIDLAAYEPGIVVRQEHLDRDDYLLAVQNGVIDLRTGEHRMGRREDLLTKQAGVAYDPAATCPQWLAFLRTIFAGNEVLMAYIQRAVGYLLTGNVMERVLFILHGAGANGKSSALEVLRALLGDYAMQTPAETLMASGRGSRGVPNDIARLAGARFVAASETEEGHRLAESAIKQMTGGDTLTARFLFKEYFDFQPKCKFLVATNHKPEIRGTDPAIWARIHLIPFAVCIPKERQDRGLREKLLAELPGILNWAIQGCLAWQATGLQPPQEVLQATEEYRSEQNLVALWIKERCHLREGARSNASQLYHDFRLWCEMQGEKTPTQRRFGERLQALGYQRIKSNSYVYLGLSLREPMQAPPAGLPRGVRHDGDFDPDLS